MNPEQAILGLLWANPDLIAEHDIPEAWFAESQHRRLFRELRLVRSQSDGWLLLERLGARGESQLAVDLTDWGGRCGRSEMPYQLDTLRRVYEAREARNALRTALDTIDAFGEPIEAATTALEGLLVAASPDSKQSAQASEMVEDVVSAIITRRYAEKPCGVTTGIWSLDELIGGLEPSKLYIIGGRPGQGKTTLGMKFAEELQINGPVVVFSMEMRAEALIERQICTLARVDHERARRGRLTDDEEERLRDAAIAWKDQTKMIIHEKPAVTAAEVASVLKRVKRRHGQLGGVIVDYVQLMGGEHDRQDTRQRIMANSRALKELNNSFGCPFIVMAQLSRDSVKGAVKTVKPPELHHLQESSALEQDADCVIMVHRPDKYDSEDRPGLAELYVCKQRSGREGMALARYNSSLVTFEDDTKL